MNKKIMATALASLPIAVGPVYSQEAGKPRASNRLLEEVMVTAQKREEDAQDIPITIQAFSGEKLDAFNIEDTADLQKITPGLTFTYTYGYTLIYLRGVGSEAFLPNADPSVATYIDGINIPASQGKQDSLGPVKRVEVLKGPQGTLFGRNATAGAINITTEDPPVDEFIGNLKYVQGNYDTAEYQAFVGVDVPGVEGLGFTLSGFKDTHENYGQNFSNGEKRTWREDFSEGGRAKIKWDFLEDYSLTLIGSYVNQFNGNSLTQENTRPSLVFGAGAETDEPDRDTHTNYEGGNGTINTMYGAIFEWRPGPVDIKLTYSDQLADVDWGQYDYDSTDEDRAGFFVYNQYNEQETIELQITSNAETPLSDKLEWVAGYYGLKAEGGFGRLAFFLNTGLVSGLIPTGLVSSVTDPLLGLNLGNVIADSPRITLESAGILTTDSDALYAQGTWTFNDEWALTLGARYQEETRGIGSTYLDFVNTLGGDYNEREYFSGNDYSRNTRISTFEAPPLEETTLSPKISLQWFPTEVMQVYTSLQRGYKSPTYNIVNFFGNPDAVKGEETIAAELGIKSEWLDGTLKLNGALFASRTKNQLTGLVSFTSGAIVRYGNADEAEVEGAEVDFQWQPMPNWNPGLVLTGGATYVESIFTEYEQGEGFDDTTGLYFGPGAPEDIALELLGLGGILPVSSTAVINGPRDFSGNDVPRSPNFTSTLSLNQFYNFDKYGAVEFGVDYSFKSEYFTTAQNSPFYVQDQYELWSVRASWFYDPWGIQVTAFVDNAKDKDYYSGILQQDFGRTATLAPPRLYGLKLKWDFDVFVN
ncbi:TonB-dependent receptor [Spongiibacter sp. UBA1325]|uniref:TonB-dependent receptor n=1 Tax=Spongiibacter sp. UBA1325 TaxID=1947543 RepID=UPI0025800E95|nr:TonB-dependent receptor [Spongiibacter sp. UBA1325]|tara:strand:+ start:5868 stop:8315 length:2448 start_codon:yes stop_codon:yes gene_type:complete